MEYYNKLNKFNLNLNKFTFLNSLPLHPISKNSLINIFFLQPSSNTTLEIMNYSFSTHFLVSCTLYGRET